MIDRWREIGPPSRAVAWNVADVEREQRRLIEHVRAADGDGHDSGCRDDRHRGYRDRKRPERARASRPARPMRHKGDGRDDGTDEAGVIVRQHQRSGRERPRGGSEPGGFVHQHQERYQIEHEPVGLHDVGMVGRVCQPQRREGERERGNQSCHVRVGQTPREHVGGAGRQRKAQQHHQVVRGHRVHHPRKQPPQSIRDRLCVCSGGSGAGHLQHHGVRVVMPPDDLTSENHLGRRPDNGPGRDERDDCRDADCDGEAAPHRHNLQQVRAWPRDVRSGCNIRRIEDLPVSRQRLPRPVFQMGVACSGALPLAACRKAA